MKTSEKQVYPRILALHNHGYTVSAAARKLNCSAPHLWNVLAGKRTSTSLMQRVNALPARHYFAEASSTSVK